MEHKILEQIFNDINTNNGCIVDVSLEDDGLKIFVNNGDKFRIELKQEVV